MKNLLGLIFLILIMSCAAEPIENHKGAIIYLKNTYRDGSYRFTIKSCSENNHRFMEVYVLEYDFIKYNVGDTIK